MKDVLKLMDKDHEGLEILFNQFVSCIKNKSAISVEVFINFKQALQKHFQWEENILFPLFEAGAGLTGKDTIFVLKSEHDQIKDMFIQKIDRLLTDKNYSEIHLLVVGLEEMLSMHRNLETDVFYPWFDDSLDSRDHERILKLLKNKLSKS